MQKSFSSFLPSFLPSFLSTRSRQRIGGREARFNSRSRISWAEPEVLARTVTNGRHHDAEYREYSLATIPRCEPLLDRDTRASLSLSLCPLPLSRPLDHGMPMVGKLEIGPPPLFPPCRRESWSAASGAAESGVLHARARPDSLVTALAGYSGVTSNARSMWNTGVGASVRRTLAFTNGKCGLEW